MIWDDVARRAFGQIEGSISGSAVPAKRAKPRLGLALGGGAARGWAHIGVLRALDEAGFKPAVIAGTSIGSLVGACYAADKLDQLEEFALSLTKRRVIGLLDVHLRGSGLIGGERLKRLLDVHLGERSIESLPIPFTAIATEFGTGHEIWLTHGNLIDSVRASYALPGILDPVRIGGRWLMDGALVNPIPVTAARALGADIVLCVNLNADIKSRGTTLQSFMPEKETEEAVDRMAQQGLGAAAQRLWQFVSRPDGSPGLAAVMVDAFNITQDRISRSRLAGDPPDLTIGPKLGEIGLFEFHRAQEIIRLGHEAAMRALDDVAAVLA